MWESEKKILTEAEVTLLQETWQGCVQSPACREDFKPMNKQYQTI